MSIFITKYDAPSVPCEVCAEAKTNAFTGPKLNMGIRFSGISADARIEITIHKNCLQKAMVDGLTR